jgi:hypothetical protein
MFRFALQKYAYTLSMKNSYLVLLCLTKGSHESNTVMLVIFPPIQYPGAACRKDRNIWMEVTSRYIEHINITYDHAHATYCVGSQLTQFLLQFMVIKVYGPRLGISACKQVYGKQARNEKEIQLLSPPCALSTQQSNDSDST